MKAKLERVLPGLKACLIVTVLAVILGNLFPSFGKESFAILLGIIFGNLFFSKAKYFEGFKWAEKNILALAIVLMGLSLNLRHLISFGIPILLFTIFLIFFIITISTFLGKLFKLDKKLSLLIGVGNAICGSSAIATVAPIVKPKEEDLSLSLTSINVLGTILLFLLPFIAIHIFHFNHLKTGFLIGESLQSVGQVVASGSFLSLDTTKYAILFKMIRVSLIGLVALVISFIFSKGENEKKSLSIPKFIILFFIFSVLSTLNLVPEKIKHISHFLSEIFLTFALVAIGMRVNFRSLLKAGPKVILFNILISIIQIFVILLFIKEFFKTF